MKKNSYKDSINVSLLIVIFLLILFSIVGFDKVNGSTVDWDSQHWIIPEYFRTLFYNTNDLFPSFAFNLGSGQNIFNLSYYGLLNPFILISYLLPSISMVNYIEVSMILIVIFSIVLMYFWLRKRFDSKYSFIGTLLFLLSGPVIYHTHRHIMFINYMPFLLLGLISVDRYFEKNKKTYLIISIFLMIMTSYYYSVCGIICIILYGIFKYIEVNDKITFKKFIVDGLKFAFTILVPILMSCVLLLPTMYSILNNRADITSSVDYLKLFIPTLNLEEILYNSYTIGTTSILFISVIFGLFSKNKSLKFISIIFSIVFIFPIIIYLFSGFMYVRGKVLIPLLPIAILLIVYFIKNIKYNDDVKYKIIFLVGTLIQIIFYIYEKNYLFMLDVLVLFITYYIFVRKNNKDLIILPLCFSALLCCLINNYSDKLVLKEDISLQFNTYNYDKLTPIIEDDKNVYRVANNILGMKNINRVITSDYYLPSIYSSLENQYYYNISNDGLGNEQENRISTAIMPSKNILFNTLMSSKYMISSDSVPIGYENVENSNVYINENVLPIGFATSKLLSKNEYDKLSYPDSAFALVTNVIVDKDVSNSVYKSYIKEEKLTYDVDYNNLSLKEEEERYIINSQTDGNIIIKLDKEFNNKLLFISFDMNYSETCLIGDTSITINDVKNTLSCRGWTYHNKNYRFDYVLSSNDTISELNVKFDEGKYDISNIKVYSLDYKYILDYVNSVDEFVINKEETKGDVIVGDINVNENGYFFLSIPYEKEGFTIYVDDKIVDYELVNESFIGFPINEGHHVVKIIYTSPLLLEGMIVSITGYMIFLPIIYTDLFRKRIKK